MNLTNVLVVIIIFLFSIAIRMWTLNDMGRTWDEGPYVEEGYVYAELIKKGDFTNNYWYQNPDHPPLARYLYGFAVAYTIEGYQPDGEPIFQYDYTYPRVISIILASLAVVLVVLIGWRYFSQFVGIVAGIILSLLPLSVGYSQIATLESFILFFFTLAIFLFLFFLEKPTIQNAIFTGVAFGMAMMVKQTNALLVPLFILLLYVWNRKNTKQVGYQWLLPIFFIGFITFFILWPMPFFHLDYVIAYHNNMWLPEKPLAPPELIFGRFMLTPEFYYVLSLLITTPLIILLLFFSGVREIVFRKKRYYWLLLIWFLVPLLQSFYHFRQHNIRYIIEIYAPFALIAAIGLDALVSRVSHTLLKKYLLFLPVLLYLLIVLFRSSPYYLDYFNGLVGGTKTVYEKKLFLLGWWGQGMKEAGNYLQTHAKPGSTVGVAISPQKVFPALHGLAISEYSYAKTYDYVVVSYFNVLREGFDDTIVRRAYRPVYTVMADGATLVTIYKRR